MQKLQGKLKNVPAGASQARCATSSVLNKEATPSVQGKVLTCNNLDGNLLQRNRRAELNRLCWCIRKWCDGAALHTLILNVGKKHIRRNAAIQPPPEGRGLLAEIG